jgi:hypothetical protein
MMILKISLQSIKNMGKAEITDFASWILQAGER